MVSIAFCQATYSRDFDETKKCIERVSKYTDYTIISYDNSLNKEQIKWLNDNSKDYHIYPVPYDWIDNMPEMRNSYLNKAYELGVDWICVSDPDELYSKELCVELRKLIEKYDSEGYNRIGVPCVDRFTNIEWLDSLDLIKESPGGYHETSFWKPILIFKITGLRIGHDSAIRYEGIGKEKNVHETLMGEGRVKSVNLDKKYNYVHDKSALKIWRNAGRNMWISGGGDNVGSVNPLWRTATEVSVDGFIKDADERIMGIRDICDALGINGWKKFEEFVMIGQDKFLENYLASGPIESDIDKVRDVLQEFDKWLVAALQSGVNPWQTETRECAKWYYALNRGELDDFIIDLIEDTPKVGEESELDNFVSKTYFKVLGRHPDTVGKENYVKSIKEKRIKRENLENIFKESNEYRTKFPFGRTDEPQIPEAVQKQKTQELVSSIFKPPSLIADNASDSEIEKFINDTYLTVLGREADAPGKIAYIEYIKSGKVKPHQLEDILKSSNEYKMKPVTPFVVENTVAVDKKAESPFRKQERKTIRGQDIAFDIDCIDVSKYNTSAMCLMGYRDGIELIKKSIRVTGKEVDEIHIQADDFSSEEIKGLLELGKEIGKEIDIHIVPWNDNFSEYKNKCIRWASTEWVLILDMDEVPTPEMAKRLKEIILKSDRGNNFDMVSFDVIDVRMENGAVISEIKNKGGKALLHWRIPAPYTGDVHIWLKSDYYPWKVIHAPVAYKHVKDVNEILERSARNIWLGGGSDTVKEKNELWTELRTVSDSLGLKTWALFNDYLKAGNIDNRVYDIFVRLSKKPWKDAELMDMLKYYTKLHPDIAGYGSA